MLANELAVVDGAIVAKSGARYRLLYLGGTSRHMTLPTLQRIAALAKEGATVVGEAPVGSPSLKDDAGEFAILVHRLWPGGTETRIGRGRILAGRDLAAAFARLGIAPDFAPSAPVGEGELLFQHRTLADADIYFVSNRSQRPLVFDARFRVAGRAPEIWHADSGAVDRASYRMEQDRTVVPMVLAPEESCFLVFRHATPATAFTAPRATARPALHLDGAWQLRFQPDRGAPAGTTLAALAPLETNIVPGIRYFSGVTTYRKRFTLPRTIDRGPLLLDLGRVGDVAEVRVNGRPVGTSWHAPFRLDIAAAARPGANELEVRVANLWVNRLIGDAQPGAAKITFTTAPTYQPDAPLRPSGLIGPVTVTAVAGR